MEDINIISYDELRNKIIKFITNDKEIKKIDQAYEFAELKHKNKKRASGEDFINHPLSVADILTSLNVDSQTIVAALLHEVINHGNTKKEEIEELFGEEVANIVETVSKINKLVLSDDSELSAIYLRKVLVGLAEDVRVLYIKLADRLHNMRTIWALDTKNQKLKIHETETVLIPIAHRLGINSIKSELEDLCLKYSKPDVYQDVLDKLNDSVESLNDYLLEMKESISQILTEHGIKFQIKGRVKSVHSIYKKLSKGKKFSDIHDILALRVFLEEESDCYLAVGLIHAKYRPVPGRFKDYIAMPKENMYQSLHTTVFGRNGYHFEVQLRTYEMDEIAEKGMAAHWTYKEKGTVKIQKIMEQKLEMFRNLIEANNENATDIEFASKVNSEFLAQMIYVFTPKGDVVELPMGATPIDFAYRIHSDVGDKTIGAIVNEKIVPLDYNLQDGDIIKINTNNSSTPSAEWLNFVKTTHARNKIKSFFSKQDRALYIEKGQSLLEREVRRKKLSISEVLSDEHIKKILNDLKLNDLDELYLAIGSLRYMPTYIINLVNQDKKNVEDALLDKIRNRGPIKNDYKNDVIVAGTNDIKVTLAKCCKPVIGDEIVGYVTKGDGVLVHRKNCKNIYDTERLIDVKWNETSEKLYLTDLKIETIIYNNALVDIITKASLRNVYIEEIKNHEFEDYTVYDITIKIKNKNDLNMFINDLEMLSFVKKVVRISK